MGLVCVYTGTYNSFCGGNRNPIFITTNGSLVGVQLNFTSPIVYVWALADSASTADVYAWSIAGSELVPVGGTLRLSSMGLTVVFSQPPFLWQGCAVEGFLGEFVTTLQ